MDNRSFLENIAYIIESTEVDYNVKINKQGAYMDSEDFNKTMSFIEKKLNDLYEKTRLLEEVSAYAKDYLASEVFKNKAQLYHLLESAETSRDNSTRSGYKLKTVPIRAAQSFLKKDRDGKIIAEASTIAGKIGMNASETIKVQVKSLECVQEQTAFVTNPERVLDGNPSRSFYMLNGPATNGVSEEYILEFDTPGQDITHVDIDVSNCELKNVQAIRDENRINIVGDPAAGFRRLPADKVSVTITDKSYRQVTYEYDEMRMSSDFWSKVGENEYFHELGVNSTFNAELESGLQKYREDYDRYMRDLSAWQSAKAAVEAANAAAVSAYERSYDSWVNNISSSAYGSVVDTSASKSEIIDALNSAYADSLSEYNSQLAAARAAEERNAAYNNTNILKKYNE